MFDSLYLAAESGLETATQATQDSAFSGAAIFAWSLFLVYMVVTFYLAYLGHKATSNFADFAVGKRDMNPWVAGLTMGACLASTATFLINPGFVYHFGLSALITYSVPLLLGIFAGMFLLGPGFRKHGDTALTMPLWVGQRYKSRSLRTWFASLSLLNIFYIVLIIKSSALIMQSVMNLPYHASVIVIVLVVFTYVTFGGTYAHAYTNTAQGAMMLLVALIMVGFAAKGIMGEEGAAAIETISKRDSNFFAWTYPGSRLFSTNFEVFFVPFIVGFVIVTQPHLLIKTLYLRDSKDISKFALVSGISFVVFTCILFAGLAARLSDVAIVDPKSLTALDKVTATWIKTDIGGYLASFISIAILAAAMSTLDGLLVAVSAIIGADVVTHPTIKSLFKIDSEEAESRASMIGGQLTIFGLGILGLLICWNPPELVGIFAIFGIYGLLAVTAPAFILGIFMKKVVNPTAIMITSVCTLIIYAVSYFSSEGMLKSLAVEEAIRNAPDAGLLIKLQVMADSVLQGIESLIPNFLVSRNPGYLLVVVLCIGVPMIFILNAVLPANTTDSEPVLAEQASAEAAPVTA